MKRVSVVCTIFACLILVTSESVAQGAGNEWEILIQEVSKLYRSGNYERAVMVAKKALKLAEAKVGPDHPDVATSLNNLGLLYVSQGAYAKAEPLYKRSLAINEKALGRGHPAVATSLTNLGSLYQAQGAYAKAEPLYKRSLAINEKALGPDHPSVGRDLNNLGLLYYNQGAYNKECGWSVKNPGVSVGDGRLAEPSCFVDGAVSKGFAIYVR